MASATLRTIPSGSTGMSEAHRAPVCGIVLLDKPAGLSSNAALQRVRHLFRARKAGHTGNLDPLASGMLPICLGEATKIAGELLDARKQYLFTVRLGERTVSGDAEHEVIERRPVPPLDGAAIDAVLRRFEGELSQVPPMHSALKHEGERLYRLARRGIEVEREPRAIRIDEIALHAWAEPQVTVRVTCSKGTYVRVLAEEIAAALGTCGYVVELRRTWTAPFENGAMTGLETLDAATPEQRERWLLPIDHPLQAWPRIDLAEESAQAHFPWPGARAGRGAGTLGLGVRERPALWPGGPLPRPGDRRAGRSAQAQAIDGTWLVSPSGYR